MASRTIAVKITVDNRAAVSAIGQQTGAQKKLQDSSDQLSKSIVDLSKNTKELSESKKTAEQHTHSMTAAMLKGFLAAKALTQAFGLVSNSINYTVGESVKFEFTLSKVSAVTDTTGDSLNTFKDRINEVAVSSSKSRNEIAAAALEIAKIGLTVPDTEKALKSIVDLSTALDEDLVSTSKSVISILNVYSLQADDAAKITDELAFTVKNSALDVQEFSTAFSYAGGSAALAGVKFTELSAAMQILSNAGIRASTIGTQLRRIIADLSNENSKAGTIIGGNIESYGSMANALKKLGEKHLDLSQLTTVFGRTASSVASILIKYAGGLEFLEKRTERATGLTSRMAQVTGNNLYSAIGRAKNSWLAFVESIGSSDGIFTKATDFISKLFRTAAAANKQQDLFSRYTKETGKVAIRPEGKRREDDPEFQAWMAEKAKAVEQVRIVNDLEKELGKILDKTGKTFDQSKLSIIEQAINAVYGDKTPDERRAILNDAKEAAKLLRALNKEASVYSSEEFDALFDKKKKKKLNPASRRMLDYNRAVGFDSEEEKDAQKALKIGEEKKKAFDEAGRSLTKYAEQLGKVSTTTDRLAGSTEYLQSVMGKFFPLVEIGFTTVDALANQFADNIVELQNPIEHFGDVFKDALKSIIAELTKMIAKLLIIKAITLALDFFAPGVGSALEPALAKAAGLGGGGEGGLNFASGTDQVVRKPTRFIAGEAGPERVSISQKPYRKSASNDQNSGITIVVNGDINDADRFVQKVNQANERIGRNFV